MRPFQNDWIEILAKAVLPRGPRHWIRRRRGKAFFRRQVRPTDVFLVGHPKSGNTWLAYMLAILLIKDDTHQVTMSNVGNYVPYIHGQDLRIAAHADLPDPRILRNECPVFPDLYPKTIYLMRDPRAVLVSFYHNYRIVFDDRTMTLEAFLDAYLSKTGCFTEWNAPLVRWDRQVLAWTERAKRDPRVLVVKYEDMVRNRRGVLEDVIAFAGIPCEERDLARAEQRGDFDAMRRDEEAHGAEAYRGEIGRRGRFVRQGTTDGWQQEMDGALAGRIEVEFAPAMRAGGYLP